MDQETPATDSNTAVSGPVRKTQQVQPWLSLTRNISLPAAAGIYLLFMFLVYWPVFFGLRFFWSDFISQEYPIREFCFYSAGLKHALPFWNPYAWGWEPLLADPQNGFWYPANLLQIALVRVFAPAAVHLPIYVPEITTLFHLPLAALGVFYLLKKEFHVADAVALVAGLTWGFGSRIVAEQNHAVVVIPLALLPWATLLTMRLWSSWKYAVGLGLLLGVGFFASSPLAILLIVFFLAAFTVSECFRRLSFQGRGNTRFAPLLYLLLALGVTVGVSAIQLLPSQELISHTARHNFSYSQAAEISLPIERFGTLFVPKLFGENPGFGTPASPLIDVTNTWWWEGALYWGVLAEIIALFAVFRLWKQRAVDSRAIHMMFFVLFSAFAILFALGDNTNLHYYFWRYVPFFDYFRAPIRIMWIFIFIGVLLTGIGLDVIAKEREGLRRYELFFAVACGVFIALNLLSLFGDFDLLLGKVRSGLWLLVLHSFIASVLAWLFCTFTIMSKIPARWVLTIAAILIAADLYYFDVTCYTNTLNMETLLGQDSTNASIVKFRAAYQNDHGKLMWRSNDYLSKPYTELGMFLRLPIEHYYNPQAIERNVNPLRLNDLVPPTSDPVKEMEIMGISTLITPDSLEHELPDALPFLKLYHFARVAASDLEAQLLLADTSFHYDTIVYLDENPEIQTSTDPAQKGFTGPDTAMLSSYSENGLSALVRTSRPAVLVVNDLYYPAWKAFVDGKETKILRAFTSLRGIPVRAGEHQIELRYDSSAFDWGWKITLGTLAFSILALFLARKQKNPDA